MKFNLFEYFVGQKRKTQFGDYEFIPGLNGELWESIEEQHPGIIYKIKIPGRDRAVLTVLEDKYD